MYRQHFGLRQPPRGKELTELWDDGALAQLDERFKWLLQSPGVGLLTGEAGVGKTAALHNCLETSIVIGIVARSVAENNTICEKSL